MWYNYIVYYGTSVSIYIREIILTGSAVYHTQITINKKIYQQLSIEFILQSTTSRGRTLSTPI